MKTIILAALLATATSAFAGTDGGPADRNYRGVTPATIFVKGVKNCYYLDNKGHNPHCITQDQMRNYKGGTGYQSPGKGQGR